MSRRPMDTEDHLRYHLLASSIWKEAGEASDIVTDEVMLSCEIQRAGLQ